MKSTGRGLNVSRDRSLTRKNSFGSCSAHDCPDAIIICMDLKNPQGVIMKLNLIFIIMDLLTFLAYPIVFAHGKLRQFLKSKDSVSLAN